MHKRKNYENKIISQCELFTHNSCHLNECFPIFLRDVEIWIFFSIKAKQRVIFHVVDSKDVDEVTVNTNFIFSKIPHAFSFLQRKTTCFVNKREKNALRN